MLIYKQPKDTEASRKELTFFLSHLLAWKQKLRAGYGGVHLRSQYSDETWQPPDQWQPGLWRKTPASGPNLREGSNAKQRVWVGESYRLAAKISCLLICLFSDPTHSIQRWRNGARVTHLSVQVPDFSFFFVSMGGAAGLKLECTEH